MKIKISLVRSLNGRSKSVLAIASALGLRKIGQFRIVILTPQLKGMVYSIQHLLKISESVL